MSELGIVAARHESLLRIWRQRVIECKGSGMTIAQWCDQNHIGIKTYYYWQSKVWDRETRALRLSGVESSTRELPQFAQVHLTASVEESSTADIVLRGKEWSVEIRNTASADLLNQVLPLVMHNV